MPAQMTPEAMNEFLDKSFYQNTLRCIQLDDDGAVLEQDTDHRHLRPGGTVSGPTLMTLADAAMYAALLGQIGPVALAVTTNLNINFLRKPVPGKLTAKARLLKLGRRLAIGEVSIYCNDDEEPVAHSTMTYSIPPDASS